MKNLFFCVLGLISLNLSALEQSTYTTIKSMQVYPDYGGGDFTLTLNTPAAKCKGYWISKDSPAYDTTVSILLAAYHTDAKVSVFGHNDDASKWVGATTHFCKVYTIALEKGR
ncbi:hypothetical protein N480_14730 [Pseudoalteromonas luteoviolacea S2607]|uniref:hypothetical protein n=1 Tax=Pseudoalteromonas luteoviolacea TaxID=43657 RepID=UPI0007B0A53F|nr:hypothetical protein [Pseudoalteromonas luteoviolacea]KZN37996.1 hypothetical protein N480_14730 [Pseudoalteromonas luteoviolacea S2607]